MGNRGGLGPRHASRYARRGNQSQSRQRRSRTSSRGTTGDRLDEAGAGFPSEASGLLVTGGSMANIIGLAVARHVKAGINVKEDGLFPAKARMMFYGSSETHNSVVKGLQLLGFGKQSFSPISVSTDFRIQITALQDAIGRYTKNGLKPICVIGNAGTVNTGAIDDLAALADLCAEHGLWFHVDGAIGALLAISYKLN